MKSSEAEFLATEGSGCHDDMDCALFLKSARALAPFWIRQARAGLDGTPPELAAARLRAAGVEMERAMAEATGGVNTHKGLVYLMSLLLYGAGFALFSGAPRSAEAAADFAALAVRGAVERELGALIAGPPRRALTNGERLYVEHGVTGVRGEAERGFPSVIRAGLPALRRALENGASFNDAGLVALLHIMLVCEDSNVMHRAGYEYWRGEYLVLAAADSNVMHRAGYEYWRGEYLVLAAAALRRFRAPSWNRAPLYELERKFMERRVSPGGAADLLSCTYFLHIFSS